MTTICKTQFNLNRTFSANILEMLITHREFLSSKNIIRSLARMVMQLTHQFERAYQTMNNVRMH